MNAPLSRLPKHGPCCCSCCSQQLELMLLLLLLLLLLLMPFLSQTRCCHCFR